MKHINPACLSSFLKKITLLSFLFSALNFAHAQCPVPFAKGDIDSTQRNVSVSIVVTRNDITYYGSGIPLTGDSLSISQAPLHGTVTVLNDSTIQYTPYPGFVGTDFYVYTVCNACGNCAQASVSIEVKSYCPAPVAIADHYTVFNNVVSTLNVTSNDQNVAGGPLGLSILHTPHHGTVTVSGNNVVYTGTSGYVGQDTFMYRVQDTCSGGNNIDSAFVYLNVVTCQPVVAVNDTFTLQQLSSVSGNLAANDRNVNGFGNVTFSVLNNPKFGGTLTVSGTTVTYTGGANGFGLDSIRYQICTDCGCDTAFAFFNVTKKPCSKPIAVPDNEYAGYSINCVSVFNILANDTFPINGGNLTVSLIGSPLYGRDTMINGTLHYTCTDSTKVGQIDVVRYSVCNSCFCDTSFVSINITNNPCNGLNPVVNNDSVHVCRNYSVVVNVTANDYSPQGFPVTVHAITGQGQHGTASVVSTTSIQYTPQPNYSGYDYIVYQACDNGQPSLCNIATVGVYVDACSAPPVVLNTAGNPTDTVHVSVYEDSFYVYCFNYTTIDSPQVAITHIGNSIDTVTAITNSFGTHPCILVTPPNNSRTQQTIDVVICSETPACDTVVVIISVIPLDHAPVANPYAINYNWSNPCTGANVLDNDTDIDPGDRIRITTFSAVTANGGKVSQIGDSVLCYTTDSSFTGIDTFYYTICDTSNLCSSSYVVVTVPIQARNDQAITKQDSSVLIHVTANDTRASNEYITLCSQPQHGTATIDSGSVQYTPAHDYPDNPMGNDTVTTIGVDSFCYTLCHIVGADTSCATAEVYIVVLPKAKFYIPQGISPNGDGVNDKFVIASADEFPLSQLLVYNRYGDEVWRNDGDGYQNDFDGTWKKNGQPLPDGSYWYIFRFNDGVTHDRMGYIIIQR